MLTEASRTARGVLREYSASYPLLRSDCQCPAAIGVRARLADVRLTAWRTGIPRCNVHRRCFSAIRPTSAPNAAEPLDALRRRAAAAAAPWLQSARRCTAAERQHAASGVGGGTTHTHLLQNTHSSATPLTVCYCRTT